MRKNSDEWPIGKIEQLGWGIFVDNPPPPPFSVYVSHIFFLVPSRFHSIFPSGGTKVETAGCRFLSQLCPPAPNGLVLEEEQEILDRGYNSALIAPFQSRWTTHVVAASVNDEHRNRAAHLPEPNTPSWKKHRLSQFFFIIPRVWGRHQSGSNLSKIKQPCIQLTNPRGCNVCVRQLGMALHDWFLGFVCIPMFHVGASH